MMRSWSWLLIVAAACSSSSSSPPPPPAPAPTTPIAAPARPAPAPPGYDADSLGAISFAVPEGSPEARAHFARGLLALHSFWYDEATRQFQAAIAADPAMRMAYWGAAFSQFQLLWGNDDVDAAAQFIKRMPNADGLPPREAAWLDATLELLRDEDVRATRKHFAAAMEQVDAHFHDEESATFLSIALLASTRPEDPDNRQIRERAGALALAVFEKNPKHPGAAHYLIHAFDTSELASRALPMAREYARIAPGAFHARHMPAHIFSRLGMWKEAIASCQAAWDVSVAVATREKLSADHHDFHSLNWLIEMPFELGRRKDATAALDVFAAAVRAGLGHSWRMLYAIQVASYMSRTGEWSRVDELLAPLTAPAMEDAGPPSHCGSAATGSPPALLEQQAILDTRARAAAMQRDPAKTKQLLSDMDALAERLRPLMPSKEVVAQMDLAHARLHKTLLARATGDDRALLAALREAVADTDRDEANGESIHSGFLVHEMIADTLMSLNQPKPAAVEYAITLQHQPGRARALLGAARAALKTNDPKTARARYQELLALWADADTETEGLAEAKAAVR